MSQTIGNNLLQALEVVNSPYKQAHRSIDCCNLYTEYPMPTPEGRMPHFQFRTLDTITTIEVYDVKDVLVGTLSTGILTLNTIDNINYYSYMGASIGELTCGKYYLKLIGATESFFTQLFVITSICCLPQLIWWNNCNTSNVIYENGYTNQMWLRGLGDPIFESVAISEATEQEGKVFKEYGALEDYFTIEVGPIYNYLVRVLQSINLHENIVFIGRNGEFAKLLGISVEEVVSVGARCLFKVKLKMRQENAFDSNYCCDEIESSTEQGLPIPQDVGCGNADPCIAPTISSIGLGSSTAVLNWAFVPFATDYEVSVNGGAFVSVGNVNTHTLTGLDACTPYTVCIRAECGDNTSASNCLSFITASVPCGSCPEENFFITAYAATTISIAFDGSGSASGYEISWKTPGESWDTAMTDSIVGIAGTNNYVLNDLQPCTDYQIRFRPICEDNDCNPVGCWTMITGFTECCDTLIDYDIDITQGNCLDLTSDITVTVTLYDTNYTITILQNNVPVATSSDAPLVTSLAPGIYTVTVQDARCTSTPYAFSISNPCPCTAPVIINSFPQAQAATLDWSDAFNATGYELQWREVTSVTWIDITGLAASAYLLEGLNTCTVYEWRVRSVCQGQTSDWSVIDVFTTTGCQQIDCDSNEAIEITCNTVDDNYCFEAVDAGTYLETPVTNVVQFSLDGGDSWTETLDCLYPVGGPGWGFIFGTGEHSAMASIGINITVSEVAGTYTATGAFVSPLSAPDVAAIQDVWDNCPGGIFFIGFSDTGFYTIKGQTGNTFTIDSSGFTITYNTSSTLYGIGIYLMETLSAYTYSETIATLGSSFYQAVLNGAACFTTHFLIRHVVTFPSCPPVNVQYAVFDISNCECYNLLNLNTEIQTTVGTCDCVLIFEATAECSEGGNALVTIQTIAPYLTDLEILFDAVLVATIPAGNTYISDPIVGLGQTIEITVQDANDEACFVTENIVVPVCCDCEIEITSVEVAGLVACDEFWYYETADTLPDTADFISIVIAGITYTAPIPIAASDVSALQTWLNGLTNIAKFRVTDSGVGYINIVMFTGCGDQLIGTSFDYDDGGVSTIDFSESEVQLSCEDVQLILPGFDCNWCNETNTVDIIVEFNTTCLAGDDVIVRLSDDLGEVTIPATDGTYTFTGIPANGQTVTVSVIDAGDEDCFDTEDIVLPDCDFLYLISDNGSSVDCEIDLASLQIDVVNDGAIDLPMGTVFDLAWSGLPIGATFITLTGGTVAIDGTTFTLDVSDIAPGFNFNFAVTFDNIGCVDPIDVTLTITSSDISIAPLVINLVL